MIWCEKTEWVAWDKEGERNVSLHHRQGFFEKNAKRVF